MKKAPELKWRPMIEPAHALIAIVDDNHYYIVEVVEVEKWENDDGDDEYMIDWTWGLCERDEVDPTHFHQIDEGAIFNNLDEAIRAAEWHAAGFDMADFFVIEYQDKQRGVASATPIESSPNADCLHPAAFRRKGPAIMFRGPTDMPRHESAKTEVCGSCSAWRMLDWAGRALSLWRTDSVEEVAAEAKKAIEES